MKVMHQRDYVARGHVPEVPLSEARRESVRVPGSIDQIASQIFTETILPEINHEVNHGKNFATLRQIYHSLILAVWFKEKFKDSFYQSYINQGKISGINLEDKGAKDKIYALYVEAYKKGVYDYIKRERDPRNTKGVNRHYLSGGFSFPISQSMQVVQGAHHISEGSLLIGSANLITTSGSKIISRRVALRRIGVGLTVTVGASCALKPTSNQPVPSRNKIAKSIRHRASMKAAKGKLLYPDGTVMLGEREPGIAYVREDNGYGQLLSGDAQKIINAGFKVIKVYLGSLDEMQEFAPIAKKIYQDYGLKTKVIFSPYFFDIGKNEKNRLTEIVEHFVEYLGKHPWILIQLGNEENFYIKDGFLTRGKNLPDSKFAQLSYKEYFKYYDHAAGLLKISLQEKLGISGKTKPILLGLGVEKRSDNWFKYLTRDITSVKRMKNIDGVCVNLYSSSPELYGVMLEYLSNQLKIPLVIGEFGWSRNKTSAQFQHQHNIKIWTVLRQAMSDGYCAGGFLFAYNDKPGDLSTLKGFAKYDHQFGITHTLNSSNRAYYAHPINDKVITDLDNDGLFWEATKSVGKNVKYFTKYIQRHKKHATSEQHRKQYDLTRQKELSDKHIESFKNLNLVGAALYYLGTNALYQKDWTLLEECYLQLQKNFSSAQIYYAPKLFWSPLLELQKQIEMMTKVKFGRDKRKLKSILRLGEKQKKISRMEKIQSLPDKLIILAASLGIIAPPHQTHIGNEVTTTNMVYSGKVETKKDSLLSKGLPESPRGSLVIGDKHLQRVCLKQVLLNVQRGSFDATTIRRKLSRMGTNGAEKMIKRLGVIALSDFSDTVAQPASQGKFPHFERELAKIVAIDRGVVSEKESAQFLKDAEQAYQKFKLIKRNRKIPNHKRMEVWLKPFAGKLKQKHIDQLVSSFELNKNFCKGIELIKEILNVDVITIDIVSGTFYQIINSFLNRPDVAATLKQYGVEVRHIRAAKPIMHNPHQTHTGNEVYNDQSADALLFNEISKYHEKLAQELDENYIVDLNLPYHLYITTGEGYNLTGDFEKFKSGSCVGGAVGVQERIWNFFINSPKFDQVDVIKPLHDDDFEYELKIAVSGKAYTVKGYIIASPAWLPRLSEEEKKNTEFSHYASLTKIISDDGRKTIIFNDHSFGAYGLILQDGKTIITDSHHALVSLTSAEASDFIDQSPRISWLNDLPNLKNQVVENSIVLSLYHGNAYKKYIIFLDKPQRKEDLFKSAQKRIKENYHRIQTISKPNSKTGKIAASADIAFKPHPSSTSPISLTCEIYSNNQLPEFETFTHKKLKRVLHEIETQNPSEYSSSTNFFVLVAEKLGLGENTHSVSLYKRLTALLKYHDKLPPPTPPYHTTEISLPDTIYTANELAKLAIKELGLNDMSNFEKGGVTHYLYNNKKMTREIWGKPLTANKTSNQDIYFARIGDLLFFTKNTYSQLSKTLQRLLSANSIIISSLSMDYIADSEYSKYLHPTLMTMQGHDFTDQIVIDSGAGTGILSLVALKARAQSVHLIEKENNTPNEVRQYLKLNGYREGIDFYIHHGDLTNEKDIENISKIVRNQAQETSSEVAVLSHIGYWHGIYNANNQHSMNFLKYIPQATYFIGSGYQRSDMDGLSVDERKIEDDFGFGVINNSLEPVGSWITNIGYVFTAEKPIAGNSTTKPSPQTIIDDKANETIGGIGMTRESFNLKTKGEGLEIQNYTKPPLHMTEYNGLLFIVTSIEEISENDLVQILQ
ncbi:MAG: hypothetical protein GY858_09185 [Candidatus Omnitrophica bacterium]|nr:hypothetical protein [Candidatus Omnitrophota bacterium]